MSWKRFIPSRTLRSTTSWGKWWAKRKIDWKADYLDTWQHPHRALIIEALKEKPFGSVCEIGMASGPNLYRICKEFPGIQVGGVDVNPEAIAMAKQFMPGGIFDVKPAHDVYFSDKSVDVSLTDMALIYCGPKYIKKALKELHRITRNRVIIVEFHSKSWLTRFLLRMTAGYNAYDYEKLLSEAGFYDINIRRITADEWPSGGIQKRIGAVITANLR